MIYRRESDDYYKLIVANAEMNHTEGGFALSITFPSSIDLV